MEQDSSSAHIQLAILQDLTPTLADSYLLFSVSSAKVGIKSCRNAS